MLAAVLTAAAWAICHPYQGIVGDANVYMGRVVADLDPAGVGRDLLFVDDGQSRFSLFPHLVLPIVEIMGASRAAMMIAAMASTCWFLALVAFAHRLAAGRAAWAIVMTLVVLPTTYGDPGIFSFAETAALPRPFAEAAVIGALTALLSGRRGVAVALLACGMALHPLMALPGVAVAALIVLAGMTARQRCAAMLGSVAAAALIAIAAWYGWPIVDRAVTHVDADWMGVLLERSPHLFPTHWNAEALAPLIAQATTLVVAARLADPLRRRLFAVVLAVAVVGLAAAAALSDTARLLLFVQMQVWRATWLLAVVAGAALAFATPRLWLRGNGGRLVLCGLAMLWFAKVGPAAAPALAAATMVIDTGRLDRVISDRVVLWIGALAGGVVAFAAAMTVLGNIAAWGTYVPGALRVPDSLRNGVQTVPLLALTALGSLALSRMPRRAAHAVLGSAAIVAVAAVFAGWDQMSVSQQIVETPQAIPAFDAAGAGRPREVLWLESRGEPWFMLGRPQYLSAQQGVGSVFSRALAMEWHRRAEDLVALGLAERQIFRPSVPPAESDRVRVTQQALESLCRHPDAPGVVILPLVAGDPVPSLPGLTRWSLPAPLVFFDGHPSVMRWRQVPSLAFVPCHAPIVGAYE